MGLYYLPLHLPLNLSRLNGVFFGFELKLFVFGQHQLLLEHQGLRRITTDLDLELVIKLAKQSSRRHVVILSCDKGTFQLKLEFEDGADDGIWSRKPS